ncbi:uncharacterized protein LOC106650198 [Trichogramma pretiosum]|uniref:uncharacterized protein LOC106650198 n=1 Tax=Trichogramma pretiosum TaxID=7493 RepID=UPI0006C98A24|nr:uncharacterized protein LOC106650198 [Trichogramma pretiosum]
MGVSSEDVLSFSRQLSSWWSEEAEYVLQRIERWAAYARGYNRLRSVRLSPGRMTMQDEPEARWTINKSTQRLEVEEDWAPSFTRRRGGGPIQERSRLNCCPMDYKSAGKLESRCLEEYSMDHSIYFKTIGDLRQSNSNRSIASEINGNNSNGSSSNSVKSPTQLPLDCGDFLSSDFDDDEEDEDDDEAELAELDAADYELREQLDRLEADRRRINNGSNGNSIGSGIVQLCRSCIDDTTSHQLDELNGNYSRRSSTAALQPRANNLVLLAAQ